MAHPVRLTRIAAACAWLALAGCSALPGGMPPGTPIDKARHSLFGPTAEYRLANGGTRLEFAQGRQTYMLDFDPQGALVTSEQVLTELNLESVPAGVTEAEVRMRYGRPAWIYGIGYQRQHVWNYRFAGGDCVWYQISIDDASRRVTESGLGQDPACDGPSKKD